MQEAAAETLAAAQQTNAEASAEAERAKSAAAATREVSLQGQQILVKLTELERTMTSPALSARKQALLYDLVMSRLTLKAGYTLR